MATFFAIQVVLAEANVTDNAGSEPFPLKAPGTISGIIKESEQSGTQSTEGPLNFSNPDNSLSQTPGPFYQQPRRYNYMEGNLNFPQYGQDRVLNNPWYEQGPNRRMPPPPQGNVDSMNPWDLSGFDSPDAGMYQPGAPSYNPQLNLNQGYGQFGSANRFRPGFPNNVYQDNNRGSTMPFMDGMMPGLGDDNFGLPFSPFGMF